MKKYAISVVLVTGLAVTTGGWVVSDNTNHELLTVIEKKDKKINVKSTEIANLENVVVKKDSDLKAKKLVIEKQKIQINKQNKSNKSLMKNNKSLKTKNKSLKEQNEELKKKLENFNKKRKGSDVGGRKLKLNKTSKQKSIKKTNSVSGNNIGSFEMSSYVSTCKGCTGITTSGVDIRRTSTYQGYRIIATDPSIIPLWSIVKINTKNGSFNAISLDTGGAIKGRKIDFLVSSVNEANHNGMQNVTIEILRRGK